MFYNYFYVGADFITSFLHTYNMIGGIKVGILSGLGNMGIDIKGGNLFSDEKSEAQNIQQNQQAAQAEPEFNEEDFLLKKTYTCPICGASFKNLAVKANKARMAGQDIDLRPKYEPLDVLKYTVIKCTECGYAARGPVFNEVSSKQKTALREKVAANYKSDRADETRVVLDYDAAINHFQLALGCAIVKGAKNSEKAYLCLQTAWIVRGRKESLDRTSPTYAEDYKECEQNEAELLTNSLEGFIKARASEDFPMCGMDQYTVDYIIAALGYECKRPEVSMKLLSELIVSKSANSRIKDKARNLKELIQKERG